MTRSISLAACVAMAIAAGSAFAQTAAKPAAGATEGKTLSGKPASGGKIMTKDELRACIKRQDELATRKTAVDKQTAAMESERTALLQEKETLKADQANFDQRNAAVRDLNARMKAFGEQVEAWNARLKQVNESGKSAKEIEAAKAPLIEERAGIDKTGAALNAERDKLAANMNDAALKQVNDRAAAVNAKTDDWNTRNKQQQDVALTYEDDRASWNTECGGRRYREDDEKAIRAGK